MKMLTVCHSEVDWCTLLSECSSAFSYTAELAEQLITWNLYSDLKGTVSIQIKPRFRFRLCIDVVLLFWKQCA